MPFYKRKNIRLPDYNYCQEGGYFITICTHNKACLLSHILDNGECSHAAIRYTPLGRMAERTLWETAEKYGVTLDSYVIMPNHIHAILFLQKNSKQQISIGKFIGAYKSIVVHQWTKKCNAVGAVFGKLWQRNYYEHILRNEQDYTEKRKYIEDNPDKWRLDQEFVE